MDTELLNAPVLKHSVCFEQLSLCHAVLGIPGIIHNAVAHRNDSARIKSARHYFRVLISDNSVKELDVGNIIKIDDRTHVVCELVLLRRCIVR